MKKSSSITLALVGSAWLATGCGDSKRQHRFFDPEGNPVPRERWKNEDGTPAELYDEEGNPVSADQINQAYSSTTSTGSSSSTVRHYGYSSGWYWGHSYYPRSSYPHTVVGGSSGSGSRVGGSSSGSVSRGGFGGTGHSVAGGSSSS
ncbi:MAG: hypothetical protein U0798_03940 [Gemmataceae bacterium]